MATTTDRSRTSLRLPGRTMSLGSFSPEAALAQKQTSPTGFSSLPPSGPATPVVEQATSASNRDRAPSAIASATSGDAAPCSSNRFPSTPRSSALDSFEHETTPPENHFEDPGRSVR